MPEYLSRFRQSFSFEPTALLQWIAVTMFPWLDFSVVWKKKIPFLQLLESLYSND
jgi:hypothetical protein